VTVEKDYVFAVEVIGAVHVFDRNTGAEVGVINPGPEVGSTSGYIDVANAITAHRRENGEYLIFVEEDARGKVLMYRWTPSRPDARKAARTANRATDTRNRDDTEDDGNR
jgi:hypothetical protein